MREDALQRPLRAGCDAHEAHMLSVIQAAHRKALSRIPTASRQTHPQQQENETLNGRRRSASCGRLWESSMSREPTPQKAKFSAQPARAEQCSVEVETEERNHSSPQVVSAPCSPTQKEHTTSGKGIPSRSLSARELWSSPTPWARMLGQGALYKCGSSCK